MSEASAVEAGDESPDAGATEAGDSEFVELFRGNELRGAETEAITLRWPTQLVVLAGAEGSGKTTALASVYEQLSQGSFAGFDFAGSRSLLGFEEICHANRVASQGTRPATARTIPGNEAAYYHLALRESGGARRRRHVLFSALSGELYRWARDSREECAKQVFLHRANAIVVLVDGARLASLQLRVNAVADAASILESFLDAHMLAPGCQVQFVFSKLDCVRAEGASALEFLAGTERKLEAKFRARVPQLAFRRIAARPAAFPNRGAQEDEEEVGGGLAAAFATWTAAEPPAAGGRLRLPAPPFEAREFSKFGWRYSAQVRRAKP